MNLIESIKRYSISTTLTALMVRGASGTFVLRVFNMGAVFLTTILLTRILGAEEFGLYSFALSWLLLLGVAAKFGMGEVVTKNIALYHSQNDLPRMKGVLSFAFIIVGSASLFLCLSAMGITKLLQGESQTQIVLFLAFLLLPLQAILVPANAALLGLQQVFKAQLTSLLIQPGLFLFSVLGLWLASQTFFSAETVIVLLLVATTVGLIVSLILFKQALFHLLKSRQAIYESRAWFQSALAVMFVGSLFLINSNADIIMLGILADMESVGIYKAASRGAELVVFMVAVINVPLSPIIAKLYAAKEFDRLERAIGKSAKTAFVFGAIMAAPMIFASVWFMALFGNEFEGGAMALQVLCLGQILNVMAGPVGILLIMTGHERKAALSVFVSATVNIAMNWLLIPKWGMEGAAIATATSIIIWNLLMVYFVIQFLRLNPTVFKWKLQSR